MFNSPDFHRVSRWPWAGLRPEMHESPRLVQKHECHRQMASLKLETHGSPTFVQSAVATVRTRCKAAPAILSRRLLHRIKMPRTRTSHTQPRFLRRAQEQKTWPPQNWSKTAACPAHPPIRNHTQQRAAWTQFPHACSMASRSRQPTPQKRSPFPR